MYEFFFHKNKQEIHKNGTLGKKPGEIPENTCKDIVYSSSKKKRNTPIYFNTNYRREMKLLPIIMDNNKAWQNIVNSFIILLNAVCIESEHKNAFFN